MVKLTRLNGKEFYVNESLIEFMEETPDTVITLVNEKKIIVNESIEEVVDRILKFKRKSKILPNTGKVFKEEV